MEIQDIFIILFEKEVIDIDIRYLQSVYLFKMNKLISLEINLVNNKIEDEGLIIITRGWSNLEKLTWIMFELTGNKIASVDFD